MSKAFSKDIKRSIRTSLGRFLALVAIVALGCGFYAGLRMTGPDMRLSADRYYDGTNLYDLRVVSSLGFSDIQAREVEDIEGVAQVMATKSTDAMAEFGNDQYAVRISSFPCEVARDSRAIDGFAVESEDDSYLNRPVLDRGTWPQKAGECVISADKVMASEVKIGDIVTVLYGSSDLDSVLATRSFRVVGFVHSSSYVSAVAMGNTSLGNGGIDQYLFVSQDSFTNDCPTTELFVSVAGAKDEFSGGDDYESVVNSTKERIESQAADIAASRLNDIKGDAQHELDSKTQEYDESRAQAQSQLDAAKEELDNALLQLQQNEAQIASGSEELQKGYEQLEQARLQASRELEAAKSELEQTQEKLNEAQRELTQQEAQVQSWPTTRQTLSNQVKESQQKLEEAKQTQSEIRDLQKASEAIDDPDDDRKKEIEDQIVDLTSRVGDVDATVQQLEAAIWQLQGSIDTGDAQVERYSQAKSELDDGYQKLSVAWTEYYAQEAQVNAQLDATSQQLDQQGEELDSALSEVEKGRDLYDSGLQEYQQNSVDAESKLEDAATVIANAKGDIENLKPPEIYVLDRTKNMGAASFQADSERIDNIAAVFPFIFFLVAALVALTTMTRMVDEERIVIGTYKALGYGRAAITWKYIVYAAAASVAGALIGIILLSQVLPATICRAYAIIYNVPLMDLPIPIDLSLALLSAGMGVGVTVLATWIAARATLREQPASLILPRSPKPGKRILAERITPLWSRLSFSWKVTLRNIFRYKKRLTMTVIGIAGCTALLLTGLGLHNAIWDIIDNQFEDLIHYNVVVKSDSSISDQAIADVESSLEKIGHAGQDNEAHRPVRAESTNMHITGSSEENVGVEVVVPEDAEAFGGLRTLRTRIGHTAVPFDDQSVIVTEKLAQKIGVGVGDEIRVFDQDDIGNAVGQGYALRVTGIVENYIGDKLYVGKAAFGESTGQTLRFGSAFAFVTDDSTDRKALTQNLLSIQGVQTVTYNDETIDTYRKMLSSVNMIVVVLVVSAAALAAIVLYNLTNININERRREIASLKVLGFTPREVDSYIFREMILLTLIGALAGLAAGVVLESFVVSTAEVDYVMFGRAIHPESFVWAFVLTVVFALAVMLLMRRKLAQIDMVESLKSVD